MLHNVMLQWNLAFYFGGAREIAKKSSYHRKG